MLNMQGRSSYQIKHIDEDTRTTNRYRDWIIIILSCNYNSMIMFKHVMKTSGSTGVKYLTGDTIKIVIFWVHVVNAEI